MITIREVISGTYGAWRLLYFDRTGIQYFDTTINGYWKSFYAAIVVLPAVIVLRVLFVNADPETFSEIETSRIAIVFAIDYVFQWVVFPLVMISFADRMGRSRQYITFIVARNWAQTIQVAIIFPAALIFLMSGGGDSGWASVILLAAHLATWVYSWFIARAVLDISGMAATGIVLADIAINIAISFSSEILVGKF